MSMYNYFSKRNQMSAVMKADLHRIRTERADRLRAVDQPALIVDRKNQMVASGIKKDVAMNVITPRDRHELAWRK